MNYITTTQLRTETPQLIELLQANQHITLLHRSQILGTISPPKQKAKPINFERLEEAIDRLGIRKKTTPEQRDRIYRTYLESRYGKRVS